MFNRDLVNAVREMLERNWDVVDMASKLKMDPVTVRLIIDFIQNSIS
jgi:hypothetical protein